MILVRLFFIFSYIGLFNFGGGYAMLSFIQQEVVQKNHWMSEAEFTDIVAISQSTPGPIGINCATYAGYTAVVNDPDIQEFSATLLPDHASWAIHLFGIFGSLLASFSVLWLPFIVMLLVSHLIIRYKDHPGKQGIFHAMRPAIIGLLASAALSLINTANFGSPSENRFQFIVSILICATVFVGTTRFKWNLIYTTFLCGILGILLYGVNS